MVITFVSSEGLYDSIVYFIVFNAYLFIKLNILLNIGRFERCFNTWL